LVGRAAETASPVLVEDVDHSIGWLPNPLLPETKSELAVPVVLGKQVLGVIDVQQNKVGGLTEDDVSTLQLIAAQVAISLQTTRTYERTRAQAQMESLVNSITEKIQTAQTLEDTLQITARELGAALGSPQTLVRLAPRPQTQTPEQNTEELNA
jgi:GAF domain-containing protein